MTTFDVPSLWSDYKRAWRQRQRWISLAPTSWDDDAEKKAAGLYKAREDIGDRMMDQPVASLADLALKARLVLKRNFGNGFSDDDVRKLCKDIRALQKRGQ